MTNPNKNPKKGFIDELTKPERTEASKPQNKFTWEKPVVGTPTSEGKNVMRRLKEQRSVASGKSNIADEAMLLKNNKSAKRGY